MPRMVRSVAFMVVVCAVCTAIPAIVRAATAARVEVSARARRNVRQTARP